MNRLASAGQAAADRSALDDGIIALVHWRLNDPAWALSFADLLEDVRTCIDPGAEPPKVLAALRDALGVDGGLAARARALAIEAQRLMALREGCNEPDSPGRRPRSLLSRFSDLHPMLFGR